MTRPTLPCLRPYLAVALAVAAGWVSYVQVAAIEPHVEVRSQATLLQPTVGIWTVAIKARGGGEVTDLRVTTGNSALEIVNPAVGRLKSGEAKAVRVLVQGSPAQTPLLEVRYDNPEPQVLTVPLEETR
jgi:hypothetical protein